MSRSKRDSPTVAGQPCNSSIVRQHSGTARIAAAEQAKWSFAVGCMLAVFCVPHTGVAEDPAAAAITFSSTGTATHVSAIDYKIEIRGDIKTPHSTGTRTWPMESRGAFRFEQRSLPTDLGGPFTLRAVRRFSAAGTQTTVGTGTRTGVSLSKSYRTIHTFGSDTGLVHVSPKYALPRQQLDLLQMPCDVLVVAALLPSSAVSVGDKWNTDDWVMPMVMGVEAVIEQSATCELKSANDETAIVLFNGRVHGATLGSETTASISGEFTVHRRSGMITSLKATQKEERTPGSVSPGLDVTAVIDWTQTLGSADSKTLATLTETAPSDRARLLLLQTSLKLQLTHSREWHLFHETPSVLMMRQLRDGNLISQCNISSAVTVAAKQHTPDSEFLSDVTDSVKQRNGRVVEQETVRDDNRWRIRHIRAIGDASGKVIVWDYYLCSTGTGEQFSMFFSHAQDDAESFGDEATKLLAGLQIARKRPALPFR
ncbi:MAG TPA: hypothetical protein EYG03_11945 [Planctomycetes bacterium]|nr:hypothetical protein [Fuerstiella sp.]HIK92678.1 hypothetical protein [Planctomycetota bacterium]